MVNNLTQLRTYYCPHLPTNIYVHENKIYVKAHWTLKYKNVLNATDKIPTGTKEEDTNNVLARGA